MNRGCCQGLPEQLLQPAGETVLQNLKKQMAEPIPSVRAVEWQDVILRRGLSSSPWAHSRPESGL